MKKLMFAMAIAATVSFAQAEDTPIGTTTTFDNLTADTAFSTAVNTDWTNNTDTQGPVDATVKAYDKNAEDYDAANGDNYLQLDGVQNLAKKIGDEGTAIGDGLYIDTMVKFTASEDAPTPGEGDKLVVWLKQTGDGDDATYTLMVTAGKIDTDNEQMDVAEYATDAEVEPDKWYNLKVQAFAAVDDGFIPDDGVAGFVVYIDGKAVATATLPAKGSVAEEAFNSAYADYVKSGAYSIFPSIIDNSTAGAAEVKQLVFSGSGAIDTVAAFHGDCAPDPVVETYAVTYTGAENVTVVTDPADTTALAAGATVAFTVTPAENYEYATTPSGWTAGANGAITMTYTVVAEGENVVTIPAPTAMSTDVIDPASGDVAVTVTAESESAAVTAAKALVSAPAGATVDAAAYAEYFDYSAVAGEAGKYTVSLTGVKETVTAGVLESAVERLTDDEATTIVVPAGLYYSITPSTGLPISGEAVKGLSTGGTVTVEKPGTTAGFYEVKVSATPIE